MYATLFDKRYLSRGISMIESLLSFEKDAAISVLCLDLETEIAVRTLSKTLNVSPVSLSEIGDDLVSQIRGNRTYREFCWALSSVFCIHLLNQQNSEVIYIDADVYFFGNPKSLLEECRKGDIAAIRHRFPERLRQYEINGIYNVQWVYFANTKIGREACAVWAKQCIACSSYLPERGLGTTKL
jgi:lipopolysaccharide biosynthesis glycosyltransferase